MEEELILSTPCLVAQAQRQKWGAGTVSERNRKLMPQYPAVGGRGLGTLKSLNGWLHCEGLTVGPGLRQLPAPHSQAC